METVQDVDRAIEQALVSVKKKRLQKYTQLIERAQSEVAGGGKLERQKKQLTESRQAFSDRLAAIDKHTDPAVRAALDTVRRAVVGNISGIDEKLTVIEKELEQVHKSNTDKSDLVARLKDRMEFLFDRTYKPSYMETLQPKTYLPECRPEIRKAWDMIVAFAGNRPTEKDRFYVDCVYNAALAEVRFAESKLDELEIDEAFVVEKLKLQIAEWAKEAGAVPEAARSDFQPPGGDWLLYQTNQAEMGRGRLEQLKEKAKDAIPQAAHDVDPFLDKLIDSGIADWIRGKRILFYGANASRSGMAEFARFVEEDLEAKVFWFDIEDSRGAISKLVRGGTNAVDLVIMWDKFAPPPRQAQMVRAAKGCAVPLLKLHSTNRDIIFSELAGYLGKSL